MFDYLPTLFIWLPKVPREKISSTILEEIAIYLKIYHEKSDFSLEVDQVSFFQKYWT